jgi:dihydropyrimidinase
VTTRVAGGTVVTPAGVLDADVLVDGDRIAGIVQSAGPPAGEDVDARGCVVLPGGVDPHTHPLSDIRPATLAALNGGTTTVVAFTAPRPGESPAAAWRRATEELLPLAAVDVRLHPSIWEPARLSAHDLRELRALGATSVKLFLAYGELGMQASDETLRETLRAARELGLVTMVHCENGDEIERLVQLQLDAGHVGVEGFVAARPPDVEQEAVERVLAHARSLDAPVYLVHLSTAGSVELVRDARGRRQTVWAEVCTHHLVLDESRYTRADAERWLQAPPLRSTRDVDALWEAILDGTIDTIGSDHAQVPYRPAFETDDFRSFPYGIAGVEERVPVVISEGRRRGVSWERLASLLASTPAAVFSVHGKGVIAEGAEPDLVLWEPGPPRPVAAAELSNRDTTAFEGVVLDGRIRAVMRGGRIE